jgi:hypothetical protein
MKSVPVEKLFFRVKYDLLNDETGAAWRQQDYVEDYMENANQYAVPQVVSITPSTFEVRLHLGEKVRESEDGGAEYFPEDVKQAADQAVAAQGYRLCNPN